MLLDWHRHHHHIIIATSQAKPHNNQRIDSVNMPLAFDAYNYVHIRSYISDVCLICLCGAMRSACASRQTPRTIISDNNRTDLLTEKQTFRVHTKKKNVCIALKCKSVCADSRGKDAKNPTNQTNLCNMRFLLPIYKVIPIQFECTYTETHAHKKKDYTKRKRKINLLKDEKNLQRKVDIDTARRRADGRWGVVARSVWENKNPKRKQVVKSKYTPRHQYIYLCIVRISARTLAWTVDVMCKKKKAGMCPCTHAGNGQQKFVIWMCVCLWIFVKCDGHRFFVARALIWVSNLFWIFERAGRVVHLID